MKAPKRLVAVAVAAVTTAALAGCSAGGASPSATGAVTKGGDLKIAWSADIIGVDQTRLFDNNSIRVIEQITEPLFMVSEDGAKVDPWLATGYTISSDKKTYVIKLRSGVKFSNGDAMTADDVKFSIDEDTKSGAAGWGFVNSAISSVDATDASTVTIHLKYAWAPLIADLSLFANGIVPKDYGGKTREAFFAAPIGTGPYEWDTWKKGQYVRIKKNPGYWQKGKPNLDTVTWSVVPDANTRKLQLQGGQIDIDDTPDWSSFASLKSTPNVQAKTFPSTYLTYVAFNQKRAPFSDEHIRRAIAYATDRTALVKAVLYGNGKAANSLLMPGVPYYDENAAGPALDLAKAKQELAASSKPGGFSTTLLISSGDPNQASVAQILQSELKAIGITMQIKQLDPTANKQARLAQDFDMTISGWTMDIPDPDEWTSFAVDPKGGSHSAYTSYDDSAVVALNKAAQQETDSAKRNGLYGQLQQKTGDSAFLDYLYYSPYAYATTDEVRGFHVTPLGNYHTENISLAK